MRHPGEPSPGLECIDLGDPVHSARSQREHTRSPTLSCRTEFTDPDHRGRSSLKNRNKSFGSILKNKFLGKSNRNRQPPTLSGSMRSDLSESWGPSGKSVKVAPCQECSHRKTTSCYTTLLLLAVDIFTICLVVALIKHQNGVRYGQQQPLRVANISDLGMNQTVQGKALPSGANQDPVGFGETDIPLGLRGQRSQSLNSSKLHLLPPSDVVIVSNSISVMGEGKRYNKINKMDNDEQRSSTADNVTTQSTRTATSSYSIKEFTTLRTLIFRNRTEQLKVTTPSDKKGVPIETRILNNIPNGTNVSYDYLENTRTEKVKPENKSKQTVNEKFTTIESVFTDQESIPSRGGQTLPDESVRSGGGMGQAEMDLNGPPVASKKSGKSTNGGSSNNSGQSTNILIENNFGLSTNILDVDNEGRDVNTEKSTTKIVPKYHEVSFDDVTDDDEYSYYSDLYVDESRNILVPESPNLPSYTQLVTSSQSTGFTESTTSNGKSDVEILLDKINNLTERVQKLEKPPVFACHRTSSLLPGFSKRATVTYDRCSIATPDMEAAAGTFTGREKGMYQFTFSALFVALGGEVVHADLILRRLQDGIPVVIGRSTAKLNEKSMVGKARSFFGLDDEGSSTDELHTTSSMIVFEEINPGDQVYIEVTVEDKAHLNSDAKKKIHFTGVKISN